jgi:hypothetical protein
MFAIGFLAAFSIGLLKLLNLYYYHRPAPLVTDSPLFYISLTTMILGTQLFLAGFIGELILRSKNNSANYTVLKEL